MQNPNLIASLLNWLSGFHLPCGLHWIRASVEVRRLPWLTSTSLITLDGVCQSDLLYLILHSCATPRATPRGRWKASDLLVDSIVDWTPSGSAHDVISLGCLLKVEESTARKWTWSWFEQPTSEKKTIKGHKPYNIVAQASARSSQDDCASYASTVAPMVRNYKWARMAQKPHWPRDQCQRLRKN